MTAKTSVALDVVDAAPASLPGMEKYLQENARPIAKLEKLADELLESMKSSLKCFFSVCETARDLDKAAVRHVLREKGFEESRISEIIRVAHSTPEIWDQYKAKAIGFKLALQKARDASGGGEKRSQTERKRFCDDLRRVLEEYFPVAGDYPRYIKSDPVSGDGDLESTLELPAIRVHGKNVVIVATVARRKA